MCHNPFFISLSCLPVDLNAYLIQFDAKGDQLLFSFHKLINVSDSVSSPFIPFVSLKGFHSLYNN
jgi:hypothetical protein